MGFLDRLKGGGSGPSREQIVQLALDSFVSFDDRRWRVAGHLRFDEEGFRWVEHRLVAGDGTAVWLSVDEGRSTPAIVWTDMDPAGVQGGPTSSSVQFYGQELRLAESGRARFSAVGETETPEHGSFEYADFHGSGGFRVSFEKYTGPDGRGLRRALAGPCENCGAPLKDVDAWHCPYCRALRPLDEPGPPAWEVAHGKLMPLSAITLHR